MVDLLLAGLFKNMHEVIFTASSDNWLAWQLMSERVGGPFRKVRWDNFPTIKDSDYKFQECDTENKRKIVLLAINENAQRKLIAYFDIARGVGNWEWWNWKRPCDNIQNVI